jgi:hypothetical protein
VPSAEGTLDFESTVNTVIDSGYGTLWWAVDLSFWPNCHRTLLNDLEFVNILPGKFNFR